MDIFQIADTDTKRFKTGDSDADTDFVQTSDSDTETNFLKIDSHSGKDIDRHV